MKNLTLYFVCLFLLFVTSFFLILADSLNMNALSLSLNLNKKMFSVFPQGWAFFTRSPREAQIQLFKIEGGKPVKIHHFHCHSSNFFGIQRNVTRLTYEIAAVYNELKKTDFKDGKSNIQVGYLSTIPDSSVTVINEFDNPRLSGEYILVSQDLVPWAWANNLERQKMDCKVIKINVICK